MKVGMIAIGDELLIGQVTDINSGEVARAIEPMGWALGEVRVVHDEEEAIRGAIAEMLERYPVVLTTGGLGPTRDDITKRVMMEFFGGELVENRQVLKAVMEIFDKRGIPMNRLTATQAMVPSSCSVIVNEVGTAPVMVFERDGRMLVAMPGVPFEAQYAMKFNVIPLLREKIKERDELMRETLIVTGISESAMAEELAEVEDALPEEAHLAYLPQPGYIKLRVDCRYGNGEHHDEARTLVDDTVAKICDKLGRKVLARGDKSLAQIVMERLEAKGMTMGAAESCTGGNIAHTMTLLPGVSDVFTGSVTSYSNQVKMNVLGVKAETLERLGAVSEPVVEEMADGARRLLGVDFAVAVSGIAGPGGGSEEKPVGTVCMAVSTPEVTESRTYWLPGNRSHFIERATTEALKFLLEYL